MKSVLRIYLDPFSLIGLPALIEEATLASAGKHDEIASRVRTLLREHPVLCRFSDEELKMGNLTYRCPVWIEFDDVGFDIIEAKGLGLDRRIASNPEIIDYFAVRHYFNVSAGERVKLGRNGVDASVVISGGENPDKESRVAWIVSYDPTRDNPLRYRLDVEAYDLDDLSWIALKIIACENFA